MMCRITIIVSVCIQHENNDHRGDSNTKDPDEPANLSSLIRYVVVVVRQYLLQYVMILYLFKEGPERVDAYGNLCPSQQTQIAVITVFVYVQSIRRRCSNVDTMLL